MQNPLTAKAFLAWVEKQPADKKYSYSNCGGHCAYGQYLAFLGLPIDYCGIDVWGDVHGNTHPLPDWVDAAVKGGDRFAYSTHTFGALADRLRASQVQP